MKCVNCGKDIADNLDKCPYCNNSINNVSSYMDTTVSLEGAEEYHRKQNYKKLFIVFSALVIIFFCFTISYFIFKDKNYNKYFTSVVDFVTEELIDNFSTMSLHESGKYNLFVKYNETEKEIKGTYNKDINHKYFDLTIESLDDIKGINVNKENTYLEFDNQVYHFNNSSSLLTNNYNSAVIIYAIQESLNETIDNSKITKEKVKLNFNDEIENYNKYNLNIDEQFKDNLCKLLKENVNYITEMKKITEKDPIKVINEELKKLVDNETVVSLYVRKKDIKRIEIVAKKQTIRIDYDDEIFYFTLMENEKREEKISLAFHKEETSDDNVKTNYSIEGKIGNDKLIIFLKLNKDIIASNKIKQYDNFKNYNDLTEEEKMYIINSLKII